MTQQEITMKCLLDNWYSNVSRMDNLFDLLTDDQLQQQVSPGRNRGIYLLGHMAAVHSRLLPMVGAGDQLHTYLDEIFLTNPDNVNTEMPAAADLRKYWKEVNGKLATHFSGMTADDWFTKHSAVSAEDFAKEPHRNKLNLLISRTTHMAYHFGQLIFLKSK